MKRLFKRLFRRGGEKKEINLINLIDLVEGCDFCVSCNIGYSKLYIIPTSVEEKNEIKSAICNLISELIEKKEEK